MEAEIKEAVDILQEGGIILYPTDTIWGLGCDATNTDACKEIYQLKEREDSKSLIILVSDIDMLAKYIKEIPEIALNLIEVSDKPLTIIYPGATGLAENIIAEDDSIAIRIPAHEFCKELIRKFGKPIVSTSANISGEPAPTCFEEISGEIMDQVDWIADPIYEQGATGKASSIIKVGLSSEIKIIRE